ncbi:hypothetical protein [Mycetocola saprophilus]|uniref:hypothetical protein n=1 Tax=Mycetocola saprophilus TaxID=76636 RepID=UPI003BF3131A
MNDPHALVLSPALAWWDDGGAVAPIVSALERQGLASDVLDTAAFVEEYGDIQGVLRGIMGAFDLNRYTLVAGNALGGTLALLLSARFCPALPVFTVSSPVYSSGILSDRLALVAEHARSGELGTALTILHHFLTPIGDPPTPADSIPREVDHDRGSLRLDVSLSLLLDIDVREELWAQHTRAVTLIGTRSGLVTERHALLSPSSSVVRVRGAGMRPHQDRPASLAGPLRRLLLWPGEK